MKNRKLIGEFVVLDEVEPKYFEKIIEWRNNPENNKFLNQPYELTLELQQKWYKSYLKDNTQGFFIMVDKEKEVPFATLGWTDYNAERKICILGRALVGDYEYKGSKELMEGYLLLQDYIHYNMNVDMTYIHVVNENKKVISFNKRWGYTPNNQEIVYPRELFVNGMHQTEYKRTRAEYEIAKSKIKQILNNL